MDISMLERAVQELRGILRDGLIATDIWERNAGLSLAGFNSQPVAVALFTRMTQDIEASLADSRFPGLQRYYMLDMEGSHTIVMIRHDHGMLQGMLVDSKKANLGILVSVAVPKMIDLVSQAGR